MAGQKKGFVTAPQQKEKMGWGMHQAISPGKLNDFEVPKKHSAERR